MNVGYTPPALPAAGSRGRGVGHQEERQVIAVAAGVLLYGAEQSI